MPVSISCPKCKTKYSLPDELQGKPVKCKSCGVTFRTKSGAQPPVATGAKVKKDSPHVVSQQDINKFGIAGQLQRAPEIFAATSNQSPQSVALGNFALEDPGFADVEEIQPENEAKGNLRPGKRKPPRPVVDLAPYSTARLGMRFLYYSCGYLLGVIVLLFVAGLILSLLGITGDDGSLGSQNGEGGTFVFALVFIIQMLLLISFPVAFIMSVLGQILCIMAPNKNEKLAAGLVFGALFAAVVMVVVGSIMTGLFSAVADRAAGDEGNAAEAASAIAGIMFLGFSLGSWMLGLSSMYFFVSFYRHMGKNIRSKELVTSAKQALVTWTLTIVIAVVSGVVIVVSIFVTTPETAIRVFRISWFINIGFGLTTASAIMAMINAGIKRTAVD